MRRSLFVAALLTSASAVNAQPAPAAAPPAASGAAQPGFAYPDAKRVDVVDNRFGVQVADPYRWLEDDVRNDPAVEAWVTAENQVTDRFLKTLPLRGWFKDRMTQLYDYERFGAPVKRDGRYFYTRNSGLQNQAVLFVRDGLRGKGRQLIDPNGWSADGATALAEWTPSEDGQAACLFDPGRRHRLALGQGHGRRDRQDPARRAQVAEIHGRRQLGEGRQGLLLLALSGACGGRDFPERDAQPPRLFPQARHQAERPIGSFIRRRRIPSSVIIARSATTGIGSSSRPIWRATRMTFTSST